jgi:hypothetical protein
VTPAQGEQVIAILRGRDAELTIATLASGKVFKVLNIAWGRDDGAEFDHVTTNISPSVEGYDLDGFLTSEICYARLSSPKTHDKKA